MDKAIGLIVDVQVGAYAHFNLFGWLVSTDWLGTKLANGGGLMHSFKVFVKCWQVAQNGQGAINDAFNKLMDKVWDGLGLDDQQPVSKPKQVDGPPAGDFDMEQWNKDFDLDAFQKNHTGLEPIDIFELRPENGKAGKPVASVQNTTLSVSNQGTTVSVPNLGVTVSVPELGMTMTHLPGVVVVSSTRHTNLSSTAMAPSVSTAMVTML